MGLERPISSTNCRTHGLWDRELGAVNARSFCRKAVSGKDVVQRLQQYARLDGHRGCVNTVCFTPSGERLLSGSDDLEVRVWDWAARKERLRYASGHSGNVFQARAMPESGDRTIVTCAADGQVRVGYLRDDGGVSTQKLAKHGQAAHKLALQPGSPHLFFSCGEDGSVRHFDLRQPKGQKLFTVTRIEDRGSPAVRKRYVHSDAVGLHAIAMNQRRPTHFAVGGRDKYARVYDVRRVQGDAGAEPVDTFSPERFGASARCHSVPIITCVEFSKQEELLVSYNDECIYLFQPDQGWGPWGRQRGWASTSTSGADGGAEEGGRREPQRYEGHRNSKTIKGVNFFGPNSEYVMSGSDCGHVYIWQKKGGALLTMFRGDREIVNCLEPHPEHIALATSGLEHNVKIWTPEAEEPLGLPKNAARVMANNKRRREELGDDFLRLLLRHHREDHPAVFYSGFGIPSDDEASELDEDSDDDDEDDSDDDKSAATSQDDHLE